MREFERCLLRPLCSHIVHWAGKTRNFSDIDTHIGGRNKCRWEDAPFTRAMNANSYEIISPDMQWTHTSHYEDFIGQVSIHRPSLAAHLRNDFFSRRAARINYADHRTAQAQETAEAQDHIALKIMNLK